MCEPYSVRRRVPGTPPASDIARSVLYVGTGHMLIPTELTASAGLVDFGSLQVVLAVRCTGDQARNGDAVHPRSRPTLLQEIVFAFY